MTSSKCPVTLLDQLEADCGDFGSDPDIALVLDAIAAAGGRIAEQIMRAGILDQLGYTGEINVQDEEVRELDIISNELMADALRRQDVIAGMASEEMPDILPFAGNEDGKYLVLHDPLDGSGNVDINGSMGTIFSVHQRQKVGATVAVAECLRMGSEQIAAGYILYGPSTFLAYSAGGPVHGFTLERANNTFVLTHANMKIPAGKGSFAVNEANEAKWSQQVRDVVSGFKSGAICNGKRSARYVGALVADFHRTMIQGGIYMYPGEVNKPRGKLRLLYEAAPLAYVAKYAGGWATDGRKDILAIEANELHQRTALYIGGRDDVEAAMRVMRG